MASEKVSRKSSEEGHLKKSDAAAREESFQTRSRAANRPLRNKRTSPKKQNIGSNSTEVFGDLFMEQLLWHEVAERMGMRN